ncbi:RnfABCDGE type electron transport complex subunit D [Urbifossiella limnaea]|uniref:Electron transport complex subunit RsxD n=1 Tax=Urbifossiella limnaea TaxID=2528023 RepID=A0A517XM09_9BACT|nr:RnfABCDGE type electron transport complex subunit D [Urbifossiella limnaea]QDU18545.1 Electron transport complex subunit RsxD [Urbifossiella limnaea]
MTPVTLPTAPRPPAVRVGSNRAGYLARVAATAALVAVYYLVRDRVGAAYVEATGDASGPRVVAMTALLAALLAVWWRVVWPDPKLHAPILITAVLALGDASAGILETQHAPPWLTSLTDGVLVEYSPTFLTIGVTVLTELLVGRFFWGTWPNLTSAYISGISAGILIKSPVLWPFLLCGMISITSKYVLRVYGRHLWNPTNFGVTMMLFLAPQHVASLTVQAGNNGLAVAVIWVLGGMIMYKLGRFHIPLAFVASFVPLAFLRSSVTGHPWQTEIAPITSPMFQLYIFFMITDPPTTTRKKWSQVLVAVLVAVMETVYRLAFKDVHSLYHALFTVGPLTNLIEIAATHLRRRAAAG